MCRSTRWAAGSFCDLGDLKAVVPTLRLAPAMAAPRKTWSYNRSMTGKRVLETISDNELLRRLAELLQQSRRVESELVAHIAEVDERRLYAREAFPSMFAYCTEKLNLSEHEAYLRITVGRASRQHPNLLEMLSDGRLHLSGIAKIAPHLTESNRENLLARATHKSKRDAECTPVAQLGPERVTDLLTPPKAKPALVEPLAPTRYKVQFTANAELRGKLERLRALRPGSDLAGLIEEAVTEKLERLEAKRFGKTKAPRKNLEQTDTSPSSRYIPAPVRRAVSERDGDQYPLDVPHPQRVFGRVRLRKGGHGEVPTFRGLCARRGVWLFHKVQAFTNHFESLRGEVVFRELLRLD